ncbi:phage tail protein [Pediococcus pentosaceus]|uniref:phage tail protein n=1 Tax=Pediococcus pentosaceus TaxID=1255 RepID=UPI002570F3B0|nr:phage tail protein [Pediococcus pentosaceus]
MLIIKNVQGTENALKTIDDLTLTQTLGAIDQLTFNFIDNSDNKVASELVMPRSIVTVPENNQQYMITTPTITPLGRYRQYAVTALHVGQTLHDQYIDKTLTKTQSLDDCMKFITQGTKFTYEIHDKFSNYAFSEEFGNARGDDLLTTLSNDFGFEYYFDNFKIHIYKTIGKDNSFLFVDGANVSKITDTEDYSNFSTHIKGTGKTTDDSDGKKSSAITAEYTSPLAGKFGIIDADPVSDERFTTSASLQDYLKKQIKDYPEVQYTIEWADFSKNAKYHDLNDIKVGNSGYLRDRYGIDVSVRITELVYNPQSSTVTPQITFGNKLFNLTTWSKAITKANKDNSKLSDKFKQDLASVESIANSAYDSRLFGKVVGESEY